MYGVCGVGLLCLRVCGVGDFLWPTVLYKGVVWAWRCLPDRVWQLWVSSSCSHSQEGRFIRYIIDIRVILCISIQCVHS